MPRKNHLLLNLGEVKQFADQVTEIPPGRTHYRVRPIAYEDTATLAADYSSRYWKSQHSGVETDMRDQAATVLGWLLHAFDLHGACYEDVLWNSSLYVADQLSHISEDSRIIEPRRDRMRLSGLTQAEPPGLLAVLAERALQLGKLLVPEEREIYGAGKAEVTQWLAHVDQELRVINEQLKDACRRGADYELHDDIRGLLEDVALVKTRL